MHMHVNNCSQYTVNADSLVNSALHNIVTAN